MHESLFYARREVAARKMYVLWERVFQWAINSNILDLMARVFESKIIIHGLQIHVEEIIKFWMYTYKTIMVFGYKFDAFDNNVNTSNKVCKFPHVQ